MSLELFQWDAELVTGQKTIDTQHKGLIDLINQLIPLTLTDTDISIEELEKMTKELQRYVREHFATEERLMKAKDVDKRHVKEHYGAHHDFEATIKEYVEDIHRLTDPTALSEVIEFLIRWLAYHIMSIDKSLSRQVARINEGQKAQEAYDLEANYIEATSEPLLKALKSLFLLVTEKNIELNRANDDLEKRVLERTNELEKANERLEEISNIDALTGLKNRRFAITHIQQLINERKRYGVKFSLIYIDIDKFKEVNDTYGHAYGDKVLVWFADFLRSNLRCSDIPCRLGGDEFLIITNHCDDTCGVTLGKKLIDRCSIDEDEELSGIWQPSISVGIAEAGSSMDSVDLLLSHADHAMYIAKNSGGNSTEYYRP